MSVIPKFYFDAVVAIGVKTDGNPSWIGTGFLVGRKETASDEYTVYLITNYHIIEKKAEILVRFNQNDENTCMDYSIPLIDISGVTYSKHPSADLIAIQISPGFLKSNNSEYSWFALDKHALDIQQMHNTDVIEGSIVYSLGFPINMIGVNRKTPICRIGCISRISDLFCDATITEYLVDLQAIPGYSGAPVISRPEYIHIKGSSHNESSNLIGIITGTIDYSEKCDNTVCSMEHERNSGFAIVHPVNLIKEVVEMEFHRKGDSY